jgi:hypothetical protein
MSELYWNTITADMRKVLADFGQTSLSHEFYLAGGTALALQLGHRISIDLDFFSPTQDIPSISEALRKELKPFSPILADSSWGNLVFQAGGIRVGFYGYGYEMVAPSGQADGVEIASVADIALMKMDALLARASRKDFHDLYAICQRRQLRSLLDLAPRKYPSMRDFEAQVARHMVYFERAEHETPVPLIENVEWETVKGWFRQEAQNLGRGWLADSD